MNFIIARGAQFRVALAVLSLVVLLMASFSPGVARGDVVKVYANVGTTLTCGTDQSTLNFGTITTSQVYNAYATTTISCNNSTGCTLNASDVGNGGGSAGLYASTTSDLIASASETLVGGSEAGFGLYVATTTAGSGAVITVDAAYNQYNLGYGSDAVGAFQTTNQTVVTSASPIANREVELTHKAAITGLTPAGLYEDDITYGCVAN